MPATVKISVKVVPGSSRSCIAGWLGDALRVRVTAPPEKGKANAAVEALISAALGLERSAVKVVRGRTAQRKVVEISGLTEAAVRRSLTDAAA